MLRRVALRRGRFCARKPGTMVPENIDSGSKQTDGLPILYENRIDPSEAGFTEESR